MDVGLGSERKYGLDREDSPSKRSDKIDDVLDKLDDHLKDGISRGQLEKCQRVLDKLADQYKDSCSKSQLSRMYKIQAKIYKISGEDKLARRTKKAAVGVKRNKKAIALLCAVLILLCGLSVFGYLYYDGEIREANEAKLLRVCNERADEDAKNYANSLTEAEGLEFREDGYMDLWSYSYDVTFQNGVIKCNEEHVTKAKDNNIAEANNKISSAKTRYDEAVSKLEEKRKEQSDRAWDLTLNSLNRIRNCNISSFGDTAHATCY